jgi:hypothetical protein
LTTTTTVEFRPSLPDDVVIIDGQPATGQAQARVVAHLERVRARAGVDDRAWVVSRSDFPAGTGLASSASAFAALSLAATRAAGLILEEAALSRLARLGSGSACRSVPAGFAVWEGDADETSFARQVAPPAFTVTSSHNVRGVAAMRDGDPVTRWATGARQGSGESVTLAFAESTDVAHLRLDLGARSLGDYPRGLVVESAEESGDWQPLFDADILPRLGLSLVREPRTPGIDVSLPPNRTRRLRLRTTGETRVWFWSIHEVRVWSR